MRREKVSALLGSGRENRTTARNVIDLSKVCENISRIGTGSVFVHIVYAVPGLEPRGIFVD